MTFTPYLLFPGTCAEAMDLYCRVFGGTEPVLMRYSEAPPEDFPEDMPGGGAAIPPNLVMHANFRLGDGLLMASDYPPGVETPPQASVAVHVGFASVTAAQEAFDGLIEGGAILVPFAETFWASGFGMLRDRFGTHWMLSGPARA
ncbi:VOC family protein [Paenirhodobacter populi]|uniref:VOC family protein n=1 Tax=Paenirhodobacter populi TaxID=2306993 RepID=A0A443KFC2_9RHOB|nr:VOC family protein [Sinirhodobacter populi]RWR09895.1 VOC family protein [Sinirhodobacter populi]RWR31393.1 VOC family protein [Sinirhodobacter populi]